jgi:hypothetical protein
LPGDRDWGILRRNHCQIILNSYVRQSPLCQLRRVRTPERPGPSGSRNCLAKSGSRDGGLDEGARRTYIDIAGWTGGGQMPKLGMLGMLLFVTAMGLMAAVDDVAAAKCSKTQTQCADNQSGGERQTVTMPPVVIEGRGPAEFDPRPIRPTGPQAGPRGGGTSEGPGGGAGPVKPPPTCHPIEVDANGNVLRCAPTEPKRWPCPAGQVAIIAKGAYPGQDQQVDCGPPTKPPWSPRQGVDGVLKKLRDACRSVAGAVCDETPPELPRPYSQGAGPRG